jgi:hypothetical protein
MDKLTTEQHNAGSAKKKRMIMGAGKCRFFA